MSDWSVSGLLSSVRQRPASSWALALLLVGGAVRCLIGPGARVAGADLVLAMHALGAVCALLACAIYVSGPRLPRWIVYAVLGATTGVTSVLVATASSRADVVISAFAYPWVALYAAHFLSRRAALVNAVLSVAGFALGATASGLPNLAGAWLLMTTTIVVVTVATSDQVDKLHRLSETDALTGVANRAGFRRLADQVLASAARRGQPVALVLCDIDGLKQVNDLEGHAAGDALLVGIVQSWRGALRGNDVLARLGGDEFAVLMPDTTGSGAAISLDRLRAATGASFSAGVATWTSGKTLDALVGEADAAMYAHKPRGSRGVQAIPVPRAPGALHPIGTFE